MLLDKVFLWFFWILINMDIFYVIILCECVEYLYEKEYM